MGKIEGGRMLVNIFFENGHPSWRDVVVELFGGTA